MTSDAPVIGRWINPDALGTRSPAPTSPASRWSPCPMAGAPETARQAYRETWCRREGLDMAVCGPPPTGTSRPPHRRSSHDRGEWCERARISRGAPCTDAFADLDARFAADWERSASSIADLPRLDLSGRDLRREGLGGHALVGANLSEARLEGADLAGARLEGANLWRGAAGGGGPQGAQLEGADLGEARLEGADLAAWGRGPGGGDWTSGRRGWRGRTSAGRDLEGSEPARDADLRRIKLGRRI